MSNSEIFNFQNTKENQSIIVAQHFEYKSAKKISFILLCVSVVVPIIINVLITLDLDNVMLGVLALISIITLIVGEILKYLIDIKKKNVPFIMNFDETVEWPEVLPSPLPTLMINGSEGIGTTIAQKWLPYDLAEVSTAYANYIKTGKMDYTLSPSFPSGGIIINKNMLKV